MNREDFGKLVQALRKEHETEYGEYWTQNTLAKKLGVSTRTVGDIETGKLKKLPPRLLTDLATTLELTSGERKEFFLAASGVETSDIVRKSLHSKKIFQEMIIKASGVSQPAYIIDSYCDIVGTNHATNTLFQVDTIGLGLATIQTIPFGLNMLQFVFSEKATDFYKPRMTQSDWVSYAYQNMMLFRIFSMRYRATEYFQALFSSLWKHKEFQRFWREVYWMEKDAVLDAEYIRVNSRWGQLVYFSTYFSALTTDGELYFYTYIPADKNTKQVFSEIASDNWWFDQDWPNKTSKKRTLKFK